ncbi:hypothetical protein KM043_017838 [Ampulex compressa]|nr:hypothetical protein KM043_017838 [Ampulex compressa]
MSGKKATSRLEIIGRKPEIGEQLPAEWTIYISLFPNIVLPTMKPTAVVVTGISAAKGEKKKKEHVTERVHLAHGGVPWPRGDY